MKRILASLIVAGFALAGCGTPTPYAPAAPGGGYGYSVQMLEDARFRVSFSGNALTDRSTAENYLLYRAAELTLETGRDHFIVVTRAVEADTTYHTTYDSSSYSGSRFARPGFGDPLWGHGTTRPVTRYTAHMEILLRPGAKPPGDAAAFDARAVIRYLGPTVVRPPGI